MNISGMVDKDRIAVLEENGDTLSYGALDALIGQFAPHFPPRSLAFLLVDNDLPSLVAYLAARASGAVPLLLNAALGEKPLASLLERYQPQWVFCPASLAAGIGAAREAQRLRNHVLLERQGATAPALHPELALLLATSGSTGSPRLVRLSAKNLAANAASIAEYLEISPAERAITTLPMSYSYGLSVINSHLLAGASLVLSTRSLVDAGFWSLLRSAGVTSFSGVPYSYEILLKLRLQRLDLAQVRTMTQAGGRLAPEKLAQIAAECQRRGIRFFPMYGQTEATARIAYLPPQYAQEKPGSIGQAIPGGRLWLEDSGGARMEAPGQAGELVYAGDNVSLGYADTRQDLARGDDHGGVLHTGDLATRDADGHYTLVGRLKRFIKVFGVRVSLDDAERLLASEGIDAAATGEDDCLKIAVAQTADPALAPRLARLLDIHPSALRVHHVEHLPRLDNGKVDYAGLKEMLP